VDLARSLAAISGAAHAESDPGARELAVVPLRCSLYGEHRQVEPVPGTRLAQACGDKPFTGFHWCGYGVNPRIEAQLEAAGVIVSARAEDAGVEAIELPDHPFFMATAFQPQVGSSESGTLHPIITTLLTAASGRQSDRPKDLRPFRTSPNRPLLPGCATRE
jgi:CTP synthase (UTP-ammonia lyase)